MPLPPQIDVLLQTAGKSQLNFECTPAQSETLHKALCRQNSVIGAVLHDEGYNKRLKVKEYLGFFASLWGTKNLLPTAIKTMQLEDLLYCPLGKLSYSQTRRTAIAREILHQPEIYFIEEPLLNLEQTAIGIVLEWLENLPADAGCVTTTSSFKDLCLLPGNSWRMIGETLQKLQDFTATTPSAAPPELSIDKIAARSGDSVFLFNPGDIDFAESSDGKTNITVHGSNFSCQMTMDELEKKLTRYGFYRCHRSYLVNMQKVKEVVRWTRNSYSLRLDEYQKDIPLSKSRIEEMKELYQF